MDAVLPKTCWNRIRVVWVGQLKVTERWTCCPVSLGNVVKHIQSISALQKHSKVVFVPALFSGNLSGFLRSGSCKGENKFSKGTDVLQREKLSPESGAIWMFESVNLCFYRCPEQSFKIFCHGGHSDISVIAFVIQHVSVFWDSQALDNSTWGKFVRISVCCTSI